MTFKCPRCSYTVELNSDLFGGDIKVRCPECGAKSEVTKVIKVNAMDLYRTAKTVEDKRTVARLLKEVCVQAQNFEAAAKFRDLEKQS